MKKLTYIAACACIWGFSSCADMFLDLEPLDTKTDVVYFQTPEHFREYATGLYGQLLGCKAVTDLFLTTWIARLTCLLIFRTMRMWVSERLWLVLMMELG